MRPPTKADPALLGGEAVEEQLRAWNLAEYSPLFVRAGYRQKYASRSRWTYDLGEVYL